LKDWKKIQLYWLTVFIQFKKKRKRDYKKEYRNYHGKPKQRKEEIKKNSCQNLNEEKRPCKEG
jgi:hypothetical protein